MIVVRDTFQAKYGRGGELVALFKELCQQWPGQSVDRIFTDASGPFDTIVTEATVENVAAWQQRTTEVFSDAYARHGYGPDAFSLHYIGYADDAPVTSAIKGLGGQSRMR